MEESRRGESWRSWGPEQAREDLDWRTNEREIDRRLMWEGGRPGERGEGPGEAPPWFARGGEGRRRWGGYDPYETRESAWRARFWPPEYGEGGGHGARYGRERYSDEERWRAGGREPRWERSWEGREGRQWEGPESRWPGGGDRWHGAGGGGGGRGAFGGRGGERGGRWEGEGHRWRPGEPRMWASGETRGRYARGGGEERYGRGGEERYGRGGGEERYGRGGGEARYGRGGGEERFGRGGEERYGRGGGEERYGRGGEERYGRGGEERYGRGGGEERYGRGGGEERYGRGGEDMPPRGGGYGGYGGGTYGGSYGGIGPGEAGTYRAAGTEGGATGFGSMMGTYGLAAGWEPDRMGIRRRGLGFQDALREARRREGFRGTSRWEQEGATVRDLMTREPRFVEPEAPARDAARVMREEDAGIVPVVLDGRVLGVITDRDLTVRVLAEGRDPGVVRCREVMTGDVQTCHPDDRLTDAVRIMGEENVRRLPVVGRDGRLQGILSMTDVAREAELDYALQESLEQIASRRSFWSRW